MSALEALADPNYRPAKGPTCTVTVLLSTMDDDDADLLRKAMANPYAPTTAIAAALADQGYRITAATLQRHRRGECRCARES